MSTRADRRPAGFTLLEVMIAMTIVTTTLVGLFSAILTISRLNATNREGLAAMRGAEQMIEILKNTDFDKVFASYNKSPADDPLPGPGTAPGPNFDVLDLVPRPDDPDGKCGRIVFPTDASGTQLLESKVDPELGMPWDLNGNGTIDALDVSSTAQLLPVTIVIEWQGIKGRESRTYRTILMKRR